MAQGRLRTARGRLRTARGSPFKPSTDGGSSEAGRRRCTTVHQDGSEDRLLEVGLSTDRPTGARTGGEPTGAHWARGGLQMLGTECSGGGGLNFDSSVVEDVDHTALSGAHGPGRAEPCGDSGDAPKAPDGDTLPSWEVDCDHRDGGLAF